VTSSNKYDAGGLVNGYDQCQLQNILIRLPNQSASLKIVKIKIYVLFLNTYIMNCCTGMVLYQVHVNLSEYR
jgi:hypothetical protein